MEEVKKTTQKDEGNLVPNYRTLAQLKEQWERAQELKRLEKLQHHQEEPAFRGPTAREPRVEDGGSGGGGNACPDGKATAEEEREGNPRGEEGGVKREGKAIVEEWKAKKKTKTKTKKKKKKKEKRDGEGLGVVVERVRDGFKGFKGKRGEGNRTAGKWVEADRTVGKGLKMENAAVENDQVVEIGRAGELPNRDVGKQQYGRAGRRRGTGYRRDRTGKVDGSEIENVGAEENRLTSEVESRLEELSDGEDGRSYGGKRTKGKNGRAGQRRGGMGYRRERVVKGGKELEVENRIPDSVEENVGVEESEPTADVERRLGKLPVREDARRDDDRSCSRTCHSGGGNKTKWQNGRVGRGRGGMGYHRDRTVKVDGLETDNVVTEESGQSLDAAEENLGVEECDQTTDVGRELEEQAVGVEQSAGKDGGQEDGRSSGRRGRHDGGRNRAKLQNGRARRGRGGMGYHRDRTVKVDKVLEIENGGVKESCQTIKNVVEVRDAVEENVGVEEGDRTAETGRELGKLSIGEDGGREDGQRYGHRGYNDGGSITKWQGRAGRGRGGGGTGYRRSYSGGERSYRQMGEGRNGAVWMRKEDVAACSEGGVAGDRGGRTYHPKKRRY